MKVSLKSIVARVRAFKSKVTATQFWVGFWAFTYAGLASADTMPWDGPLCGFANALRGPAALAIATVAFFAAGASFLWGEEIAGMSKKLVTIVMGITVLLGGSSLVGWLATKMGGMATAACS